MSGRDDSILYDDENHVCVMSQATLDRLPEYSCSIPTGKVVGKRWKVDPTFGTPAPRGSKGWLLRGYEPHPDPSRLSIPTWRIELVGLLPTPAPKEKPDG